MTAVNLATGVPLTATTVVAVGVDVAFGGDVGAGVVVIVTVAVGPHAVKLILRAYTY